MLRNRALFEDESDEERPQPKAKRELTNSLLRQAIRKQQLSVTSLQGALSGYLVGRVDVSNVGSLAHPFCHC